MTNTMIGYPGNSWEEEPRLGGDRFRNQPMPLSREARQIAMANRQAQVDAALLANGAALQNLKNALNHGLELAEGNRREERRDVTYTRMERSMDEVDRRAGGNPNRHNRLMRVHDAWENTEVYILATNKPGTMR